MKERQSNQAGHLGRRALTCILSAALAIVGNTTALGEESVILSLHEQIGREVEAMRTGFEQLGTDTPALEQAREWAQRGRKLAQDSPEFARARAEFVNARSQDLEYRVSVADGTYRATASLTRTIERLIAEQSKTASGQGSLLGGENEAIIRQNSRQLQGVDRMMAVLIESGLAGNTQTKVRAAHQAYQVKIKNTLQRINSKNATGIEKLTALQDTAEGLAFLMRAYRDGLDLEHMRLTTLAIGGQADAIFADASLVIAGALAVLNPDNMVDEDTDMFMEPLNPAQSEMFSQGAYRPSVAGDIAAAEAALIANRR